jgi:pimeloyl-ACP methyl ester carboxylesterase
MSTKSNGDKAGRDQSLGPEVVDPPLEPSETLDPLTPVAEVAEAVIEVQRRLIRAPDMWIQMMESTAWMEMSALMASWPVLRMLGRGDRHPVLVMPGFLGGDLSTLGLRFFIRSWGYWTHGWGGGENLGPTPEVVASIEKRLYEVFSRHERKVTLVGWSAGGMYARKLARQHPEMVRSVVTLASPLQMTFDDRSALSFLTDQLRPGFDPDFLGRPEHELGPLPVPATSIYTRTDGVARWYACLDVVDDQHENVEILGSHVGQGFNPSSLYVLADRLAQPEDDWRPFHPPAWTRGFFPRPEAWEPRKGHGGFAEPVNH